MTTATLDDIRADFFLTLARAFTPPIGEAMQRAFIDELPDDLAAMSGALGYPVEAPIEALPTCSISLPVLLMPKSSRKQQSHPRRP